MIFPFSLPLPLPLSFLFLISFVPPSPSRNFVDYTVVINIEQNVNFILLRKIRNQIAKFLQKFPQLRKQNEFQIENFTHFLQIE
jgi:hypothetical protein